MTRVHIDCDPGHDDAIAILYAARHLDVIGISTIFGNQTVELTTRNALSVLALAGLDIPVARGCDRPLIGEAPLAPDTHGATGLDGVELPEPKAGPVAAHAAQFIIEAAGRYRGELVVAITGAHTNVALALRLEPRLRDWLKAITIMGGTAGIGNLRPQACVNVLSDPEAAHIVFTSGIPIRWIGYETSRTVLMRATDIERLRRDGGKVSRAVADIAAYYRARQLAVYGIDGAPMHDVCAIVPLVRPDLIRYEPVPLAVELASPLTRGMTIIDRRPLQPGAPLKSIEPKRPANVEMAVAVDVPEIIGDLVATMLAYDRRA
ncbi:MAG: nucleoside hydrolase [Proteobacteria bacterium]|nr:nucleoside hydrolase [Pseudomonadota bacterium]